MPLVETLKNEHKVLKALLREIQISGIATEATQSNLKKSKTILLAHLKKEDEQLYPALKKLEDGKQIANAFQEEMKAISNAVLEFYGKYEGDVGNPMTFAKDFGSFVGALNNRIIKEEVTLYPKYEEHYS